MILTLRKKLYFIYEKKAKIIVVSKARESQVESEHT